MLTRTYKIVFQSIVKICLLLSSSKVRGKIVINYQRISVICTKQQSSCFQVT